MEPTILTFIKIFKCNDNNKEIVIYLMDGKIYNCVLKDFCNEEFLKDNECMLNAQMSYFEITDDGKLIIYE